MNLRILAKATCLWPHWQRHIDQPMVSLTNSPCPGPIDMDSLTKTVWQRPIWKNQRRSKICHGTEFQFHLIQVLDHPLWGMLLLKFRTFISRDTDEHAQSLTAVVAILFVDQGLRSWNLGKGVLTVKEGTLLRVTVPETTMTWRTMKIFVCWTKGPCLTPVYLFVRPKIPVCPDCQSINFYCSHRSCLRYVLVVVACTGWSSSWIPCSEPVDRLLLLVVGELLGASSLWHFNSFSLIYPTITIIITKTTQHQAY